MHKVILFISLIVFGTAFLGAEPAGATNKLKNTRQIEATEDTTVSYGGLKIFVPAGEKISLGKTKKEVVIQADKLNGVKVGPATLTTNQAAIVTVKPKETLFTVAQGENVQIVDENGRMASLSKGTSVDGKDIRTITYPSLPQVNKPAPIHPRKLAEMQKAAQLSGASTEKTAKPSKKKGK